VTITINGKAKAAMTPPVSYNCTEEVIAALQVKPKRRKSLKGYLKHTIANTNNNTFNDVRVFIKSNPECTTKQICAALPQHAPANIRYNVSRLKAKGLIQMNGKHRSNKGTSPTYSYNTEGEDLAMVILTKLLAPN
jgi:predicted HTH transcriptional regulator